MVKNRERTLNSEREINVNLLNLEIDVRKIKEGWWRIIKLAKLFKEFANWESNRKEQTY